MNIYCATLIPYDMKSRKAYPHKIEIDNVSVQFQMSIHFYIYIQILRYK